MREIRQAHPAVKTKALLGYEILRKVTPSEIQGLPVNPRLQRGVLGTREQQYRVAPGIDLFELGLISQPGPYELLPISTDDQPLWDDVIHLIVSKEQAERQRNLILRACRTLRRMIVEAEELAKDITAWSQRGMTHPVFGMLRLEIIEVWKEKRRTDEPLTERELDALHGEVARRVAVRLHVHLIE